VDIAPAASRPGPDQPGDPNPDLGSGPSAAVLARLAQRPRDIVIALAVLLLPVAVLLGAYLVVFNGAAPIAVDPTAALQDAQHANAFTVLAPAGLPRGWTVSSAQAGPVAGGYTLRLGYLTPHHDGLELIESSQAAQVLLPAELGADAQPADLVSIAGQRWRPYPVARAGGRALVLATDQGTVLIVGTASQADLVRFAASLR
jgi:hypothetical protein